MPEWTRDMPWKQGHVIAAADLQHLGVELPDDGDGGIVISHDCDLANDAEKEPYVEWLLFRYIEQPDGNCLYGRNPRTLHLTIKEAGSRRSIELQAPHKGMIKKSDLAGVMPSSPPMDGKCIQILQGWLAARYRRHAFPDELVERMRPLTSYLAQRLKKQARGVIGIWIDYDPKEPLVSEEPYELWLSIVYPIDIPDAQEAAETLVTAINTDITPKLVGLVLADCRAVSEEGFTLADQRRTVEFKLEYLSHRLDPAGPFLP
jgi:hypothetical protein